MSNWNKPSQVKKPAPKKPTALRGLIAGAAVVLVALGAVYFFMGEETKVEIKESTKPRRIKEVEPAKAKTNVVKVVELTPEEKEKLRRKAGGMYTNDYGYVYNRPIKGRAITNDMNETVAKSFADKVFNNFVDRSIGDLIDTEPGTAFVGDSRSLFGPSFKKKFLKSLEVPIIVSRDDPPEVATLKRAVIDAKIDLKARLDAGEDISEIMVQARDELQSLGLYKAELEKELDKIARDRNLTEEDMNDFVAAANKMMAERGMGPLTMPRMAARRFERERQLKQLQEQQNKNK